MKLFTFALALLGFPLAAGGLLLLLELDWAAGILLLALAIASWWAGDHIEQRRLRAIAARQSAERVRLILEATRKFALLWAQDREARHIKPGP